MELPEAVEVELKGLTLSVTGQKGTLSREFGRGVEIHPDKDEIKVELKGHSKAARSNYGTTRALIANMVKGVTQGWTRQLELVGTGFRAEVSGQTLKLTVGYSHPVEIVAPEGVTLKVEKNMITVEGADKEVVGQVAANIRAVRPPEPYKGKGIKYQDEVVRRKAGKAAKTVGAPA